MKSFDSLGCNLKFNFTVYNILPPLFEIAVAAMPLVGCPGLLPSLLPNWSEEVQILAQIANLIVNFWALYFGRLSMKLKNLEVFVRYRSKMTIVDEIYLSQIRMTACTTFTDAVNSNIFVSRVKPDLYSEGARFTLCVNKPDHIKFALVPTCPQIALLPRNLSRI